VSAAIVTDGFSGKSRGFGFVEMSTAEEAKTAIALLNEQMLDGRRLRVETATPSGGGSGGSRGGPLSVSARDAGGTGRPARRFSRRRLGDVAGDQQSLSARIEAALSQLAPRERDVLRRRFGLGATEGCTLEELGAQFNLTREPIRQIELMALKKLRVRPSASVSARTRRTDRPTPHTMPWSRPTFAEAATARSRWAACARHCSAYSLLQP
jgi:RNA polymerase sigma factor (sigma-70 family)